MKRTLGILASVLIAMVTLLLAKQPAKTDQVGLPTTKILRKPSPGRLGPVNSFPVTIALSPDGRFAALLSFGYGTQKSQAHQSIAVLDLRNNQITDFPDERLAESAKQTYFLGLAFSGDGKHLYASMSSITDPTGGQKNDTGNGIAVYSFSEGKVAPERFIKVPLQPLPAGHKVAWGLREVPAGTAIPYPAGLAVVNQQGREQLLVANNLSDNVILLDPENGNTLESFDLSTHAIVPSSFPYTVVATRDGRRAWCSLWNRSRVVELDLSSGKVSRSIPLMEPTQVTAPGSHPTAMLLSPDESKLYVALSNADAVAVVDTASGKLIQTLSTRMPAQKFAGGYPIALSQSADGAKLYVADASLNAVAVFETGGSTENARGFIPTDWYPSALAVSGDDLLLATAKGEGSGPNNGISELKVERRHRDHPYIPTLLYGSIARINLADAEKHLAELTEKAETANLLKSDSGKLKFRGGANPIRHVIYVIKENRTYDQVFGDIRAGNGDPSLTMYGADITPNQHKLALQFGILDDFYDSGEVSGNGHEWTNAAITSDYNEKTWQIGYRGQERTYDFQGTIADEFPSDHGEPNVDAPATGYIWDNMARNGITYRDYGEFVSTAWCTPGEEEPMPPQEGTTSPLTAQCSREVIRKGEPLPDNVGDPHGSASPYPWAVPVMRLVRPNMAVLKDHFDPRYPDFNTEYPDQLRADEFLNEFAQFVKAKQEGKGTELPGFITLYLPDDHTSGTRPGRAKPAAAVADNDLALGRVVEAVSHSPYWDDTAIFVLEDDAQDGADHVDAHRSTALVISKYSPGSVEKPFVSHRFYTTVNMVHTMEALLGVPPMNQNDAYAPIMAPLFEGEGKQPAFTADWRNRDNGLIYQTNSPKAPGAAQSSKMDFSRPDAAKASELNAILWREAKGSRPIPAVKHGVFPQKGKIGD
ncbi:MAG TPA: phosphoesterase [Terriglobales bacterium]|nr:phosphoesterase [Terriglobales bacterium]